MGRVDEKNVLRMIFGLAFMRPLLQATDTDIDLGYDNNMICLLSVLYCILLNEYILYVCIIIDIVEYKRMDVNEMVMIMIKNLKKNSKDGLLESLENYLKNFFLKHYAFRFILHTIIADKILTFKDAEVRDRNQQKC